jgi:assimilatory nitrate reductase catalytic subunit
VNRLLPPALDPVSGQPALKAGNVRLTRVDAAWYGFIVSEREPHVAQADYWARAVTATGWRVELVGFEAPTDWPDFAAEVLRIDIHPRNRILEYRDRVCGDRRYVITVVGRVTMMASFSLSPVAVSRQWAVNQLGSDALNARTLLAARAGSTAPDPGATVCSCLTIGKNQILEAVSQWGCATVDAVGRRLAAGTNCGSCRAEIQSIIRGTALPRASQ